MGVLAGVAALVVLAGCYAPSLRDCTVRCDGPSDCAHGQVCGDDGLCAAPETAGRCTGAVDAGPGQDADPPRDAAPPDAPTTKVQVQVDGEGSIVVEGQGTCSSRDPTHGKCTYDIALGITQRVSAVAIKLDQVFLGWTSMTCSGQWLVCAFVPTAPLSITAKFGHAGAR
jgi:hypothetical protein